MFTGLRKYLPLWLLATVLCTVSPACGAADLRVPVGGGGVKSGLQRGPDANSILWSIGGSVTNSNPNAWVAVRNGNDVAYIYGTNKFTLRTQYVNNTAYNVIIAGSDPTLQCTIANGTGYISKAPVTNVAVSCSTLPAAQFINGFESFDRAPDWANTVDTSFGTGGSSGVVGYCCGMPGPQAMITGNESAHSGTGALVFSGYASGSSTQAAYMEVFDLSTLSLAGPTYLSYWIYPQSNRSSFGNAVSGNQSVFSAVDITLSDGTAVRIRPGITDQFGNKPSPAAQGNLILDSWNFVLVDLGSVSALRMTNLSIGWQNAGQAGGYRGYLDDIVIDYTPPPVSTGMSTSWEDFQTLPTWVNSGDNFVAGGNVRHVGGLCCGATGPQAYVSSEFAHTGSQSLVYAGSGSGFAPNYAYMKVLDLSHSNIVLDGLATLTYWVYPQSQATFGGVSGANSASVAVDIIFADGDALRYSGLLDVNGNPVTPSGQSNGLFLDAWNQVTIPLGELAGKVPVRLDVGWSEPVQGGYRGFIDDITLGDLQPSVRGGLPSLVRVILAPASHFLMVAGPQLVATGVYSDGTQKTLSGNVTYASDNTAVATVDANGLVTLTGTVGTARIRATYAGVASSAYLVTTSPPSHTLGGTVSGLLPATTVGVVQGRDQIYVSNGSFTFPTGVADGSTYRAAIYNPTGQSCVFTGGTNTGTMPASNTSPITITCSANSYHLGGLISGLVGSDTVTVADGTDTVTHANGPYTFPTTLVYQSVYTVTISQPVGYTCAFNPSSAGRGHIGVVTNANVLCTPKSYTLGGNVSGLVSANVTLTNANNGDAISVNNGAFTFDRSVAYGGNYNVVATSPSDANCTVTDGTGTMAIGGISNVTVTCLANAFTIQYYFNAATSPNYTFDATKVTLAGNVISLKPICTSVGDNTGTSFAGGTSVNTTYDGSGYLRLDNPGASQPWIFYTGVGFLDPQLTWVSTVDAANGGSTNVGGFCCGLTGMQTTLSNEQVLQNGIAAANSVLYSGMAGGGGTTAATTKAFSLSSNNLVIAANSSLSYYIWPQDNGANSTVSGNNSLYTALDIVFTDASTTHGAGLTDANGIAFTPMGQGAGGQLVFDQWNLVQVDLSSLAGKTVDRIDVAWRNDGATGGFRGYIAEILLNGTTTNRLPNTATLDSSWTPQWANLVGYWNFDGTGSIADGASISATVGSAMTAHNSNGKGMQYTSAKVGQGIFLDSVDDWLDTSSISVTSTSFSWAVWYKLLAYRGLNPRCTFMFNLNAMNGADIHNNPACGTDVLYYNDTSTTVNAIASTFFPTGAWVHMAATGDASGLSIYRDGILEGHVSTSGSAVTTFNSMNIAGYSSPLAIVDEAAVWNAPLTASQVATLYQRQKAAFSGNFTAATQTAPFAGNTGAGMSWGTNLPHSKVIPSGSSLSESSTTYPTVGGETLNNKLALLWHMDEAAGGTMAGGADFNDFSGNADYGSVQGSAPTFGTPCMFANCAFFTGGGYITNTTIYNPPPNEFTESIWFRLLQNSQGGGLVMAIDGSSYDRVLFVGSDNALRFWVNDGSNEVIAGPTGLKTRQWHHAAASLGPAGMKLYQDGVLVASNPGVTTGQAYAGHWTVGYNKTYGGQANAPPAQFSGSLDEFALWTRALSDAEVAQVYRRGANRLQLQYRQCTTNNCGDAPSWQGPDGTNQTYYSEMDAGNNGLMPGISPVNAYLTASPVLTVDLTKPYVQYRAFLQSDDVSKQCNYGGAASCSPEVTAVELFRANYPTSLPTVTLNAGAAYYKSLTSFAETLGTAGCTAGITYSLSPQNSTSYYYTGAAWATANGSAVQSTPASGYTNAAMNAYTATSGTPGNAYFKAFLASDGNTPCALQNLAIGAIR